MKTQSSFITKVVITGSLVVATSLIVPVSSSFSSGFAVKAFAEESHEGTAGHIGQKGGSGKGKGQGGSQGSGYGGSAAGSEGGGYHGGKDFVTKGQGGPDETSEGKGPKYGAGDKDGGKPVWASEGIPEGDYGRLNVVRAPQHTRDQAAEEAISTITDWSLYSMTLSEAVAAIKNYRIDPIVRVDSPTQSIALYQKLLEDHKLIVKDGQVVPGDILVQAAIFLASASDKYKPITLETVIAVNTILGVKSPGTGTPLENDLALQAAADLVREAIKIGHDSVVPVPPAE